MKYALYKPVADAAHAAGADDTTSEPQVIDIFLQPGDFHFGDTHTRIRTLLGSCVAVTLWHPRLRIGGMCHYLLPSRPTRRSDEPDGRYADEAMELFVRHARSSGTRLAEYEAKIFGGGNMFSGHRHHHEHVGNRNAEHGLTLLRSHGLHVKTRHLCGYGHRNIVFELWSGDVWVRHVTASPEPSEES